MNNDQQNELDKEKHIETYKSLIKLSSDGYKTLLLLNGGGVLTFMNLFSKGANSYGYRLIDPMIFFILGLCFTSTAYFVSYFVQFNIYKQKNNTGLFNTAILISVMGLLMFILGCITGLIVLT